MRRRFRQQERFPWPLLIVAIIAILISLGCYACTTSDCESRGGHTEIVYGGRGGWVYEGADR